MIDIDVSIPGGGTVQALQAQPRFYREGNVDYVEISYVGSKDTNIHKVKPEHMAQFRPEWDAYCDGRPMAKRHGTPLTDLSEINEQRAQELTHRNLHNLEELAVLSDAQCQGLGHGMITLRKKAQALVMQRRIEAKERGGQAVADKMAGIGSVPAGYIPPEILTTIAAQDQKIDALTNQISALVAALAPKRKKEKDGTEHTA